MARRMKEDRVPWAIGGTAGNVRRATVVRRTFSTVLVPPWSGMIPSACSSCQADVEVQDALHKHISLYSVRYPVS